MATFQELRARYMVESVPSPGGGGSSSGSSTPAGPTALPVTPGCQVTGHVHGSRYFPPLKAEIARPDTSFVYLAGWWLDPAFSLDGASSHSLLEDLLAAKSRAGVDVRVLGWVMAPEVLQSSVLQSAAGGGPIADIMRLNGETMRFVNDLRREPTLADKACLNILAHPAGAVHLKFAVVGSATRAVGFTGGIDLQSLRHNPIWHDVQAQVTGPVLQDFVNGFRDMWEEVRGRAPVSLAADGVRCTSHSTRMPALAARSVPTAPTGTVHVQSARTLPQFNFAGGISGAMLPKNRPLSYAPRGRFEIKTVWEKAIAGAEDYIYIEDQAFTSTEVFDWINARLKARPALKVMLVTGGADPTAPAPGAQIVAMSQAINNHLLKGLSTADITGRVGLYGYRRRFVHTKSTVIDDAWAMIGSGNAMRRSLYTDFEHNVAFMDEAAAAVPAFRRPLWKAHLGTEHATAAAGIAAWFAVPFRAGPPTGAADPVQRLTLPLPPTTMSSRDQVIVDELIDPDSRRPWGSSLASLALSAAGAAVLSN